MNKLPAALHTQLCLRRVELSVFLGWPEEERQQKQSVFVDIDIFFPTPPAACETDDLQETICYATLIRHLQDHLQTTPFRLVEYLARAIYQFVKSQLSPIWQCRVHLTKYPAVPALLDGVRFSYGDHF